MPGRLIKQFREQRRITQTEMADLLYMSQSNYSKIENNKVALTAELSKRIVKLLDVKLEDILPDDAVVESPMLSKYKLSSVEKEDIISKVDELVVARLNEFRQWMMEQFASKTLEVAD